MTAEEVGTYILLLCHQWSRGMIPSDSARVALIARGDVSTHVLSKFPGGKNARMELERQKQAEYREMQSAKGRASVKARFNRGSTAVQPSHQPDTQPEANSPSPSPSPINGGVGELEIEPPGGFPKTQQEAVEIGSMIGVPPDICAKAYHKAVSRGYTDHADITIRNFSSYLKTEQAYADDRKAREKHSSRSTTKPDRNAGSYNEGKSGQYDAFVK